MVVDIDTQESGNDKSRRKRHKEKSDPQDRPPGDFGYESSTSSCYFLPPTFTIFPSQNTEGAQLLTAIVSRRRTSIWPGRDQSLGIIAMKG